VTVLIGISKIFAFICFGHYWSTSEGKANTTEEPLYICSLNIICHYIIIKELRLAIEIKTKLLIHLI
jgi:hypothetical protein